MDRLMLIDSGGYRTSRIYDWIEREILEPLYRCRYGEATAKPIRVVYWDRKHRVRHVLKQVRKLNKLYIVRSILESLEIDLLEYLLNRKSGEIWFVSAHHRHSTVVKMVWRWWRKYYDMVFEVLEAYYNIAYQLLNMVYPATEWRPDSSIEFALAPLKEYLISIYEYDILLRKVVDISRSNMTKREKEYWLLQLKNILYNHGNIVEEFSVKRYTRGRPVYITYYRLNLDVRRILRDTMERVEELLLDTYESLVSREPETMLSPVIKVITT